MGSRHVMAVLGVAVVVGAIALLAVAVQPEKAGATTGVKTCGGGSIALHSKEKRVFVLHNRVREGHGLKPLCLDPRLTRAARSHSREMVEKDYFSHPSYDGGSVGVRLKRFGYDGRIYAENLAGGSGIYGEADSTLKRWMNSPPHRVNILDGRFRRVGVGTYAGDYKGFRDYTMYTVDFGGRG